MRERPGDRNPGETKEEAVYRCRSYGSAGRVAWDVAHPGRTRISCLAAITGASAAAVFRLGEFSR
ncbi:hypothetical protein CKO38_00945 [Rhodospirillum rubrum]|nr:hypothetical protein [Rhodospirillum rubrum]MBK1675262.1 hypothetical protein [Rhodospirillum rubrum]